MKKKILFVATTPFAVNAFLRTHLAALSQYYELTLCVNLHAYELSSEVKTYANVFNVNFERKISPWLDLKSLFQLLSIIRRLSPNAIHSITPKAGLLAMLAGFIAGVPFRHHIFTGQVWANKRGAARRVLKSIDRLIVFLSTKIFADSLSQCDFLVAEGIVKAESMSMLGSGSIAGVDFNRFHPDEKLRRQVRSELQTPDDTIVFLFVGRIVRDKGIFDLVEAFKRLANNSPKVELWIVGPDEDGLLNQLKQMASPSTSRIHWLGARIDPEQYMAGADLFVLPSYREGFPSVILEAAACEIPVIAYRIYGVTDAVCEGQTGLLVRVGDIDALTSSMLSLASDNLLRKNLGQQALARVSRDFSSTAVTAEWVAFYQRTL